MKRRTAHRALTLAIAGVWIVFGLYCKVLDLVPRHEEIVARVLSAVGVLGPLSESHAGPITRAIGVLEVLLGLWVLSGIRRRLAAVTQISLIAAMNLAEFVLARDLLLWGPLNALFAIALIGVIYVHEWVLGRHAGK